MRFYSILLIKIIFISSISNANVTIGGGKVEGVYYPIALGLCQIFEKSTGNKCKVISTKGDEENLDLLQKNKIDMAIIAHDIINDPNITQILRLHDEIFTVIAKQDSAIYSIDDLKNKKVGIAETGKSIAAYNKINKIAKLNLNTSFFNMATPDYLEDLCDGKLDALITMIGHPTYLIHKALNVCNIKILDIDNNLINKLLKNNNNDYYSIYIPQKTYFNIEENINTFATAVLLVTNKKLEQEVILNFVSYIYRNFSEFRDINPVLNKKDRLNIFEQKIPFYNEINLLYEKLKKKQVFVLQE